MARSWLDELLIGFGIFSKVQRSKINDYSYSSTSLRRSTSARAPSASCSTTSCRRTKRCSLVSSEAKDQRSICLSTSKLATLRSIDYLETFCILCIESWAKKIIVRWTCATSCVCRQQMFREIKDQLIQCIVRLRIRDQRSKINSFSLLVRVPARDPRSRPHLHLDAPLLLPRQHIRMGLANLLVNSNQDVPSAFFAKYNSNKAFLH